MRKASTHYFFLFLVLAAAAGFYLYNQKDILTAYFIRAQVRALTGTDAAPKQVRIYKAKDSRNWVIQVRKMLIKNPDRFEIPNMIQLSEVQIVFDPWQSLVSSQWRIRSFYAQLSRVNFQTNGRGILNISTTPAVRSLYAERPAVPRRNFFIEHMEFRLGKLYLINYESTPPAMELHSLKGRRILYHNLDHPYLIFQAPVLFLLEHVNSQEKELVARLKERVVKYEESLKPA